MINLPHKEPIRFVKDIISKEKEKVRVSCSFPFLPSLPMICEAAAQGSAAFGDESEAVKIGFLASLKNVEQYENLDKKNYFIDIQVVFNFGSMIEYSFSLVSLDTIYVKGNFIIALQS